jgi:hypothetical protein
MLCISNLMTIKKTLASIVLTGIIGLSGCDYQISQEGVDKIVEQPVKVLVKTSDDYMNVHRLLRKGDYDKAQAVLEQYLINKIREGAEYKGAINETNRISKTASERIGKTIDGQINKIQAYLKE